MGEPVDALVEHLATALLDGRFVKLTLSKPRKAADPLEVPPDAAYGRLVQLKRGPHLSVLLRYPRKDVTQNHPVSDAAAWVRSALNGTFQNAHLFLTDGDWELRTSKRGEVQLARHKPTFSQGGVGGHDRPKAYLLDPATSPWMKELGIVGEGGHVRSDKADKHKQLQNLLKLMEAQAQKAKLGERERLRVVDMGCGKAYLTFALYDYFQNTLGVPSEVIGADVNAELVATCNRIAEKVGYTGLRFVCAPAGEVPLDGVDVLVALHACDTATDDALFRGVQAGATVVMVVPCCQKEVRPQLKPPADERPLLKHDTFKDRFAQMLTDGVRGLLLEGQGYRTQVMEFISDAHTHRNVMIVGVSDGTGPRPERQAEAAATLARYGVERQRLAELLSTSTP